MAKNNLGTWLFLIGIVIAIIAGFISGYATTILLILFIIGLVVGFLNISDKDAMKFLLATIALLILGVGSISALSVLDVVSTYLNNILGNFIVFVGSVALVVSIKSIIETNWK